MLASAVLRRHPFLPPACHPPGEPNFDIQASVLCRCRWPALRKCCRKSRMHHCAAATSSGRHETCGRQAPLQQPSCHHGRPAPNCKPLRPTVLHAALCTTTSPLSATPPAPLQDRNYLLLHGVTQQQFRRAYPGRRLLFDLGTAQFDSGLRWFVEQFEARGVSFDEIWVRRRRLAAPPGPGPARPKPQRVQLPTVTLCSSWRACTLSTPGPCTCCTHASCPLLHCRPGSSSSWTPPSTGPRCSNACSPCCTSTTAR